MDNGQDKGCVRLPRDVLGREWFRNRNAIQAFVYCILKAAPKKCTVDVPVGGGKSIAVELEPGQFASSRAVAAKETGLSEQEVRTAFALLVQTSTILIAFHATKLFSIVTVCNWHIFMGYAKRNNQPAKAEINQADFDAFWAAYPRKVGKDHARRMWDKAAHRPALAVILAAVASQKRGRAWLKDHGEFIPHPGTWLHEGRWDDVAERMPGEMRSPPANTKPPDDVTLFDGLPKDVRAAFLAQAKQLHPDIPPLGTAVKLWRESWRADGK